MVQKDILKELIQNYYPEASEAQITNLLEELSRECEVIIHAKIRETVSFERIKRFTA